MLRPIAWISGAWTSVTPLYKHFEAMKACQRRLLRIQRSSGRELKREVDVFASFSRECGEKRGSGFRWGQLQGVDSRMVLGRV